MKRIVYAATVSILLLTLQVGFVSTTKALASNSIQIVPNTQTFPAPSVGTHFMVSCWVYNVTNLYGVDIQIGWDTAWIEYVAHSVTVPRNATNGGVLNGPTIGVKDDADETAGIPGSAPGTMYWLAIASIVPALAFSGDGRAFEMEFMIVANPPMGAVPITTVIHFTEVTLADSNGNSMPNVVQLDGSVIIETRPPDYPSLPLLKVMPAETACHDYGESFSASVWLMGGDNLGVNGYWDVSGFDFCVRFNPSFINAVKASIDPDGWWSSFWPSGNFVVLNAIDNDAGVVHVAFIGIPSEMGIHTPPSGIGRLLSIDFAAIAVNVTLQSGTEIAIGDGHIAGFPHPERCGPPWNCQPEVTIPFIVKGSTVYFSLSGDVNFDGAVNMQDIVIMSMMYGCREGQVGWHISADMAPPHGVIEILDIVTAIRHYGVSYP